MRLPALTPRRLALIIAATVIGLDQLTKWWALQALDDGPVGLIDGFLQFRLVFNSGGAFSMFPGGGAVIALGAMAAVVVIVLMVGTIPVRPEAAALGLVLGGAFGNLLDRILRGDGWLDGKVVDFVDFDFFPTFNLADSAITVGAILALLLAFTKR